MPSPNITIGVFSIAHIDRTRIGGIIMMRETLLGIQAVAREQHVRVVMIAESLATSASLPPAREQIDGWLSIYLTEGLAAIAQTGTPLVLINAAVEGVQCSSVMPDNRGGVAAAIHHLIDHGHTRIAFLGTLDVADVVERYDGYATALAERGIQLDPTLVMDVPDDLGITRQIFQNHIGTGLSFSAIFTTNDINAEIVLEELRAHGYRVPEQVAVVGFDDMEHAQFTDPPLTTIRQEFYENGRTATRLLLAQIAGEPVAPTITYIPTALIIRRSCGCASLWDGPVGTLPDIVTSPDWPSRLARELVRLLRYPLPLDPMLTPAQIWPGSVTVCQALVAIANGVPPPLDSELTLAWEAAVQITTDLENVLRILSILEHTVSQLSARTNDTIVLRRLSVWLSQTRLAFLHAYTARQKTATAYSEQVTQMNYAVSKELLDRVAGEAQHLGWLAHTSEIWGCLALWDGPAGDQTTLTIVGAYAQDQQHTVPIGARVSMRAFPSAAWLPDSTQDGETIVKLLPVRTPARDWGILALRGPIEPYPNTPMLAVLLGSALERDTLVASLAAQQETLRVAHEHQLITEHTHDLLSMLDTTGRFRYASPSFQHRLGYEPATLIGVPIFDFAHPEDSANIREQWGHLKTHGLAQATFRYRHADGSWRWIELSGTTIERHDGLAVVTVGRDISERRRLEMQLTQAQKMETVGQLAGGVAHDFNNLLTVIGGYADLARTTLQKGDQAHGDLEEIQKAVERARSLTRQLLSFARQQIIEPQTLNLNDLISDVSKLLHRLIGEHIELLTPISPDLGYITADPHQIEQLLINLAINARDAMPSGGLLTIRTQNNTLNTRIQAGVEAEPTILLLVSDTGVGMNAEVKQHLFEPFFTTKGVGKGTGLGLATCYGIVRQHDGQIAIDSEVGQGTTVRITFPRVADPSTHRDIRIITASQPLIQGEETILIAEDEVTLRALAARVLRSCGYTVLETTDGLDALRMVQSYSHPIDLLLTDVIMPHMGGVDLVKQLSSIRPELKVLFTSGYTDSALIHQGQLDSGVHLLQKPFSPAALTRKGGKLIG